jgi:DNA-binding transcriptional LysR family regulator
MHLRRLRHFLSVAAEGSLSRAARAHGIAQPALTRQIQLLEAELGAPLFDRLPRGVRLTEAGQYFKDALELPLDEIETAIQGVRAYPKYINAALTVGLPPVISGLLGPQIVTRMRQDHPGIAIRVIEEDSAVLAAGLARRTIDAAILVSVIPEQRVSQIAVLNEPMLLVGAAQSPVLRREEIPFRELEKLPLVLTSRRSGARINIERVMEIVGVKIAPVMTMDSLPLTRKLVTQGDLFTILPAPAFKEEAKRGELAGIPVTDPLFTQPVLWAVKPDWRYPRIVYNELERIIFEEWYDAFTDGSWPGEWVYDFNLLSIPFRQGAKTKS